MLTLNLFVVFVIVVVAGLHPVGLRVLGLELRASPLPGICPIMKASVEDEKPSNHRALGLWHPEVSALSCFRVVWRSREGGRYRDSPGG